MKMIIAPLAVWCLGHPDDVIKAGMGIKRWLRRRVQDRALSEHNHVFYCETDPSDNTLVVVYQTPESYELIDN